VLGGAYPFPFETGFDGNGRRGFLLEEAPGIVDSEVDLSALRFRFDDWRYSGDGGSGSGIIESDCSLFGIELSDLLGSSFDVIKDEFSSTSSSSSSTRG